MDDTVFGNNSGLNTNPNVNDNLKSASNSNTSNNPNAAPYNPSTSSSPKPLSTTGLERTFSDYIKNEEEDATQSKAKALKLSYVNLMGYPITTDTLAIIPEDIAKKYNVISFLKAAGQLQIACVDPQNLEMRQILGKIAAAMGMELILNVTSQSSLTYAMGNYKWVPKIASQKEIQLKEQSSEENFVKEIQNLNDLKEKISEVPTTKIFEMILAGAIKAGASDIHIEPIQNGMNLRYRIDGVLQSVSQMQQEAYRSLLSRIKYLANMKLDIKDKPQNGRFSITSVNIPIDLRISTLPTIYGENIVMRLLKHGAGFLTLEQLEFAPEIKSMIDVNIKKPSGMILNTGPTGSGKTTTLYAIIDKLNKPGVKIITLEDPVEYRITGITQTQVDPDHGLDFASALKSALRQDPDILMVGEIRDLETAETAIQAALTGHLVLSTLHTNNAPASMARLIDIGVRPFLLPGSVNLVMAQRLVRKICPTCKEEYDAGKDVMDKIKIILNTVKLKNTKIPSKLMRGRGCPQCNNTGFLGRTPISEGFQPNPEFEKMVVDRSPISVLFKQAVGSGMITMEQDGILKVLTGVTTIEEIWRVTASEV